MAPRQLTDQQIRVLRLRALGASNHEIATRLHISKSTVYREHSVIVNTLQAGCMFQLGVFAVLRGYLPADVVIGIVAKHRPGPDWIEPTAQQFEIINLRALGWPADAVATHLGISERTLRYQIHDLREANGIARPSVLPTLATALGWINNLDEQG